MFLKQSLAIGINNHNPSRLNLNPCINDATDMTQALRSIGFNALSVGDTKLSAMQAAIGQFISAIKPGAVALFYFSGHGAQYKGNNYLIPSDALGIKADNLESTTINAQTLIDQLHRRRPRLVICVLDCCRSDASTETLDGSRRFGGMLPGFKAGLAPMRAPPGTLIAFACAAGAAASARSANNRNSLYTYHLLRYIRTPGMDIENVLKYAAADAEKETDNGQIPYRYSSCNEFICLAGDVGYNAQGLPQHRPNLPVFRPPKRLHERGSEFLYRHPMSHNSQQHLTGPFGMPTDHQYMHRQESPHPMQYRSMNRPATQSRARHHFF